MRILHHPLASFLEDGDGSSEDGSSTSTMTVTQDLFEYTSFNTIVNTTSESSSESSSESTSESTSDMEDSPSWSLMYVDCCSVDC
jgi:hypothetical protein